MGWWIVRQPNGRLARFSDTINNFTHMNMSVAEAVEVCKKQLKLEDAFSKVELGMEDTALRRWADALMRIQDVYGSQQRANAEEFDHYDSLKE
jgi:hypothetical protein